MFVLGFPLLLVPFAIYNIVAFLLRGFVWTDPVFQVRMISQAEFSLSWGDLLVIVGLAFLFLEIVKATRMSRRSVVDHLLSLLLFIAMLVEFLLVPETATATFFLLLAIVFVDVIAGFVVSLRTAQRDVSFESVARGSE
ncbi:hypothetical protein PQJ75_29160 [Rhodoplanes sp. TEM]|uniref:Transmembrane protein n=1 Tax=Rhodoplanes tepidamans TaxID=200616 RepID=A0ABT5J3U3_RHOTP|nr:MULTISPECIES: hypothetical protein [Rhodoplanes]MDC7784314.1 hypothetical protein [Rhodoplanes tepidamans]MDC7987824.1 hypothetical protein [Rhodoplanes sp. TEM]MDQ0353717.1 membrane-associated HD superfamily phosphohydrolase [Rhodoplanes tepidamans]